MSTATCACGQTAPLRSVRGHLPRGWKRLGEAATCGACLRQRYVQRSICLPIAFPVGTSWPEFGAALREQWAATTRAANWLTTQYYARDVRREADDRTLRPMPRCYLYPELRAYVPTLTPINATALIQSVEQTYRRQRYELLWTGQRSLASYRYPVPYPLHQQAWRLSREPGGRVQCEARIGEAWWTLALAGGAPWRRQHQQLDLLLGGAAWPAPSRWPSSASRPRRSAICGRTADA